MLKVKYWKKGGREKETEAFNYSDIAEYVSNAQYIDVFSVEDYIYNLKELMEDSGEDELEYLIEKLEKLNPKTKICRIDAIHGEPAFFVVKGFEQERISDYFYATLLSSKAFWDWYGLHNIIINGEQIEPSDNGVERLG